MDETLVKKVSGALYYVPIAQYNANKGTLPTYTSTNQEAMATAFDKAFNPEYVGILTDYSYTFGQENDETIYGMGCGTAAYKQKFVDRITSMAATIASMNNVDFIASVLNADRLTVVGAPAVVTAEAHGIGRVVGTPFKLTNKNHDGTVATAIAVKEDTIALVLNTDYRIYVDEDGYTNIFPLTAQAGVITVDYTYSKASKEIMSLENKTISVPATGYKFISCSYRNEADVATPRRRDVVYFTECNLDGEFLQKYYKQGDSFEGSEVTLKADSGFAAVHILKGATEADVNATP